MKALSITAWWVLGTALATTATGLALMCLVGNVVLYQFYESKLQSNLFQAFFVIGGLLLALQSFIIVVMRDNVYEKPEYVSELVELRRVDPKLKHYGPLKRLNRLLSWSVAVSLGASIAQYTIGLHRSALAAVICICLALIVCSMMFGCFAAIHANLTKMFDYLEKSKTGESSDQNQRVEK